MKTHTPVPNPHLVRFEADRDSLTTTHNNLLAQRTAATTASVNADLDYAQWIYDTSVSYKDDEDVITQFRTLIGMKEKTKYSQYRTIGLHANALREIRDTLPTA